MPHDTMEAARTGGRRKGQRTARDITNVNSLKALSKDTRVSENLWMQVRGTSRSWIFEKMRAGERFWIGLGAWPQVSLTDAKNKVAEYNAMLARGEDPRKPIVEHRFADTFKDWYDMRRHEWRKNEDGSERRYAADVMSEVTRWVLPMLADMDVEAIDTNHVRAVLWQQTDDDQPFWIQHNPTATRVRGYIQEVIGFARAQGWRKKLNCAVWDDNLEHLLPKGKKFHKIKPHPSCHPDEIAEFMLVLRKMEGKKFRALELLILTSLRAEELRGAKRHEMNLKAGSWDVSPIRMKKGNEHTVLLSTQAIKLIESQGTKEILLFGEMAEDHLREAIAEVTAEAGREWRDRKTGELISVHGFRASMATWAGMQGYDRIQIRLALGHVVDGETLRRYLRSQESQQRRDMMQSWADHLDG